ncbi:MAG: heat-inducible transcriptional repressor HrcA [Bifidobacteriaceae bacterium]|jgi:heat-inducible transcriptional repressor|nr:heat-inducible transcriptional repressor HrcA [Bifidobacteriaceae bacterium]
MLDSRRMDVLRAIVEDYVSTGEPVGSRNLVERHSLGVSPATIRNDMAALEEAGYITQPHTSAGRIPTDAGYRLFVDQLSTVKPLSAAERRAIQTLLDGPLDLDLIVDRAVRALAALTHQVALVQYPSLKTATLRHLEILELADGRCLLVIITDSGRVEERLTTLPAPLGPEAATLLRGRLNEVAAGRRLAEAAPAIDALAKEFAPAAQASVQAVAALLKDALTEGNQERIAMAGTVNLARASQDFRQIMPVLEAIEEQVVLLKLLSEMAADSGQVTIRIGHENPHQGLAETSLVAAGYGPHPNHAAARLAVLGPTRMDYPGSIAVVRAIALYLSRILAS